MQILVVDDDPELRQWVALNLEAAGHTVVQCETGLQAVDAVQADRPDVVLLDVLMPGMDGCQTARAIRKVCAEPYLPILFLTVVSEPERLVQCLEIGDGFVNKPVDMRVLEAKLAAFDRWARMANRLRHQNRKLQAWRARMEQEVAVCRHILRQALAGNRESLPGIRALHSETSTLNGDILLMHERPDGGAWVLLGDFTGYGLSAMVAALPVYHRFFEMAREGHDLAGAVRDINRLLHEVLPAQMFLAATLAEVSADRSQVRLWCGGLPDGKVIGKGGDVRYYVNSTHPPLGILPDERFVSEPVTVPLGEGDRLFLYTEALTESPCNGAPLGEAGLHALLAPEGDALERVRERWAQGSEDTAAPGVSRWWKFGVARSRLSAGNWPGRQCPLRAARTSRESA
ncbi:SpoIIE family protein phosphatase [Hahella sp. SMD15-11]|uniref:SpoIIE family protein phosphatase n=1 Tax=Thermohahella caldifontis TaxID=3142973 RepID=A0AB39USB0_9GAMM